MSNLELYQKYMLIEENMTNFFPQRVEQNLNTKINSKSRQEKHPIKYDKDIVKAIYERVKECRVYYDQVINQLK